jgi:competence protein ComEA
MLVMIVLAGGSLYTARLSEGAPRVVYTASLEAIEDESQDSLSVNINIADIEELDELPEVGPSTAESIVEYRQTNGQFSSVDELASMRNCIRPEGLTFSALLTEGGAERLELVRA